MMYDSHNATAIDVNDRMLVAHSLGGVIAGQLRRDIASGAIPAGYRLRESALAARFGVSRGPVRDALRDLSRSHLVVLLPRRGAFVAHLSEGDVAEVYQLREALEQLALRQASVVASDEEIDAMQEHLRAMDDAFERNDQGALIEADLAFHRSICSASRNNRLMAMWEGLASQSAVMIGFAYAIVPSQVVRGSDSHHDDVWRALRKRNPERAGQILAKHFQRAQRDVFDTFKKQASVRRES